MTARNPLLVLAGVLLLLAVAGTAWLLRPDAASPDAGTAGSRPAADSPSGFGPGAAGLPAPPPGASAEPVPLRPVESMADDAPAPAVVEGRIVDRAGGAIGAATVKLLLVTDDPPFRSRRPAGLQAESAGDGRFQLVGAPVGETLALEVGHADFASSLREPFAASAGETTDLGTIALEDGMTLAGTVLDGGGAPIAAATVTLSDVITLQSPDPADTALRTAVTDDKGEYAIAHLALRQYAIEAGADGFAPATTVLSLVLGAPSGAWRQDFHLLQADSRLAGLVLDPDEQPVSEATVRVSQRNPSSNTYFLRTVVTAADGAFAFESLAGGLYQLDVLDAVHYLAQPLELATSPDIQVVRVLRSLEVHGQLQAAGALPASFHVTVHPDGRTGAGLVGSASAGRDVRDADPPGSFVFGGLRPGSYRFEVSAPGYADTTSQDVILGPESARTDVVIPLVRGGALAGRLSRPLACVNVVLRGEDYDPALSIEAAFPTPPIHGLTASTDPEGRFRIEHVPAGVYTLTAQPPASPPVHLRSIEVADGQTSDVGTLLLVDGGVVFGNVLGPDGLPRQGVRISAQGARHQQQAVSDAQGAFRLEALPPGDYELTASPGNLWEALRFDAHQSVTVAAGEERPVLLTLAERQVAPR